MWTTLRVAAHAHGPDDEDHTGRFTHLTGLIPALLLDSPDLVPHKRTGQLSRQLLVKQNAH